MISFVEGNAKFNYRVGAIIISSDRDKVLLHTIKGYNFWLLPGGRVEWMESSRDAIKRELIEEIGLKDVELKDRLLLENIFEFNGVVYQEISNNFVIKLDKNNSNIEAKEDFIGLEGDKYIYKWVKLDDIDKYTIKPNILKETIRNYDSALESVVLDERH